ncbi:MAG: hypothetical protein J6B60_02605 [Clostridia bacterium]|nr:hypothetical protein [Clostridia bacterium]
MTLEKSEHGILSGNALKFMAAFFMLIDHIGVMLVDSIVLRAIGRLALPIFSYMISEGCKYTKNKLRYFLSVFSLAAICQLAYFFFANDTSMCILVTFSISILTVYALDFLKNAIFAFEKSALKICIGAFLFALAIAGAIILNRFLVIEYKFWGCMLPVAVSLFHTPKENAPDIFKILDTVPFKVLILGICLIFVTITARLGAKIQCFSFLALPLLLLYSGKRGKLRTKYFFYIFYPLHLVVLEGISMII